MTSPERKDIWKSLASNLLSVYNSVKRKLLLGQAITALQLDQTELFGIHGLVPFFSLDFFIHSIQLLYCNVSSVI